MGRFGCVCACGCVRVGVCVWVCGCVGVCVGVCVRKREKDKDKVSEMCKCVFGEHTHSPACECVGAMLWESARRNHRRRCKATQ